MLTTCRYSKDGNLTRMMAVSHCAVDDPIPCLEVVMGFLEDMQKGNAGSMIIFFDEEPCLDIVNGKMKFGSELSNEIISHAESLLNEKKNTKK